MFISLVLFEHDDPGENVPASRQRDSTQSNSYFPNDFFLIARGVSLAVVILVIPGIHDHSIPIDFILFLIASSVFVMSVYPFVTPTKSIRILLRQQSDLGSKQTADRLKRY